MWCENKNHRCCYICHLRLHVYIYTYIAKTWIMMSQCFIYWCSTTHLYVHAQMYIFMCMSKHSNSMYAVVCCFCMGRNKTIKKEERRRVLATGDAVLHVFQPWRYNMLNSSHWWVASSWKIHWMLPFMYICTYHFIVFAMCISEHYQHVEAVWCIYAPVKENIIGTGNGLSPVQRQANI